MKDIENAFASERTSPAARSMTFIIPGNPIPLARVRFSGDHCWDSQKQSKLIVSIELTNQLKGKPLFKGALSITLLFFFPMAKINCKTKKNKVLDKPHTTKPDIDNLIKMYLDCASKDILFKDDCTVAELHSFKIYGEPARTEMIITEMV